MIRTWCLTLVALAVFASCSTPAKTQRPAPPMLEFRPEAEEGERENVGVTIYQFMGENVHLLPAKRFLIERADTTDIGSGRTGVAFEVYPEQRDDFQIWTGQQVGRRVAVLHKGRVLSIFKMTVALPGEGVISGGRNGFSENAAKKLADELSRPPAQ